jgi:hypothetical protein
MKHQQMFRRDSSHYIIKQTTDRHHVVQQNAQHSGRLKVQSRPVDRPGCMFQQQLSPPTAPTANTSLTDEAKVHLPEPWQLSSPTQQT